MNDAAYFILQIGILRACMGWVHGSSLAGKISAIAVSTEGGDEISIFDHKLS